MCRSKTSSCWKEKGLSILGVPRHLTLVCSGVKGTSMISRLLRDKNLLAVKPQFFDGFDDVVQGLVLAGLFVGAQFGVPTFDQFLDRADVNVPVMEVGFQFGHLVGQELAVLVD